MFVYRSKSTTIISKVIAPGDSASIEFFESGDYIHAVEAFPNQGAVFGRSAGTCCQLIYHSQASKIFTFANSGQYAKIILPSGTIRLVSTKVTATIGAVGSIYSKNVNKIKAGRSR